MAGAGGLFVMMIGAVLGLVSATVALVFLRSGGSTPRPKWGRAVTLVVIIGSALATLMMLPAWIVVFSGTDTRGERLDAGDLPFWIYLLLVTPLATLAALGWRVVRQKRRGATAT